MVAAGMRFLEVHTRPDAGDMGRRVPRLAVQVRGLACIGRRSRSPEVCWRGIDRGAAFTRKARWPQSVPGLTDGWSTHGRIGTTSRPTRARVES